MTVHSAPPVAGGAVDGLANEAIRPSRPSPDGSTSAEGQPRWLVLKHAQGRMVIFRGWPEKSLRLAFEKLSMSIGLALSAEEFAMVPSLQGCSHLFIGTDHQKRTAFAAALRDLERAGWSVDPEATWPVIEGSYQPPVEPEDQKSRQGNRYPEQDVHQEHPAFERAET